MVLIRRGTLITCPGCRSHIAITTIDIRSCQRIEADLFDFSKGQERHENEPMLCKKCNEVWFLNSIGCLHTEHGWMPKQTIEPIPNIQQLIREVKK